ncbi:unnamed protein product [Kuraishia capsulata CBS 1993]|uniref:IMD domain-containing protein n=1 Tax=Kuraishia capsulata CBS 1993 TaxID=1382522 RepID=W6MKM9_9ASCO|nr:uncharacterized protein KUCA_T00002928001 [Kuraishia capsulata CBS 1993]CDK26951.1 unnamed protein product [Kuraishia capsulata CBS 1993]
MTSVEEGYRDKKASPVRKAPAHLSEFYSYVNGASSSPSTPEQQQHSATSSPKRHEPQSPSRISENGRYDFSPKRHFTNTLRKDSFTTLNSISSMTSSTLDLPTLITQNDVKETIGCYNALLTAAENYRNSLMVVSDAASDFGKALEECARCKGSGSASEGLMGAGGLHYLISNHHQILARSVESTFEQPVKKVCDLYAKESKETEVKYKTMIRDKARTLKKSEMDNYKFSKKKTRNIVAYKSNLMQLASQLDEIDKMKHDYYLTSFEQVQESAQQVLKQASSVVRAEVEIYEGIARKGWSGGGLDSLIARSPDPFTAWESDKHNPSTPAESLDEITEADETITRDEDDEYTKNGSVSPGSAAEPSPSSSKDVTGGSSSALHVEQLGQAFSKVGLEDGDFAEATSTPTKPTHHGNGISEVDDDEAADESFSLPVPHESSSNMIKVAPVLSEWD